MQKWLLLFFIIFTVGLATLLFLLFHTRKYDRYFIKVPYTSQSAQNDVLKEVVQQKIESVKANAGLLSPFNHDKMDVISQNVNASASLNSLAASSNMIPNGSNGTYPLVPLENPLASTCFQFEQGTIGWYWGYLTFPQKMVNIMYYIMRIELGTETLRKKHGLRLGETTVYYLSFGVGSGGDWHCTPYRYVRGNYSATTESAFRFESLDPDIACIFESSALGEFHLACSWKEKTDVFSIDTRMYSEQQPYFNGEQGCSPCIYGAGTLYWSYTQLFNRNTTILFKTGDKLSFDDRSGVGWLDRQWVSDVLTNQFVRFLDTISQALAPTKVLGRYIWLNLHLDAEQYMVFCPLDVNAPAVAVGNSLAATYNLYSPSIKAPSYSNPTQIKVAAVVTVDNVVYPTKYEITVPDITGTVRSFLVDSTGFGNTVTIDLTGNLHWSGSAILYDTGVTPGTSVPVGTAFLEANQFQDVETYNANYFKAAGLSGDSSLFTKKNLRVSQALPTILVLVFYVLMVIVWIGLLILVVRSLRN